MNDEGSGRWSHGNEMKVVGGMSVRGGEVCAKISRLDKACWRLSLGREGQARRGGTEGEGGGSSEAFLSNFNKASQREREYLLLWKPLMGRTAVRTHGLSKRLIVKHH
jgi:hypothetical protein